MQLMSIPVYLILAPVPFITLGGLCFWFGRKGVALAFASRKWPSVQGTVVSLTPVHEGVKEPGEGSLRWQLYVRLHYDVRGHRHWGDWTTPARRTIERAQEHCGLREGGPITIFYDPASPQCYVVEPGFTAQRLGPWIASAFFIAIPMIILAIVLAGSGR
jgi:hypothetical protein